MTDCLDCKKLIDIIWHYMEPCDLTPEQKKFIYGLKWSVDEELKSMYSTDRRMDKGAENILKRFHSQQVKFKR